jgi:hypothetical protein
MKKYSTPLAWRSNSILCAASSKSLILSLILVLTVGFLSSLSAQTTYTWVGGGTGLWTQANNWSPVGVPDATNEIARFDGSTTTVNIKANINVWGLYLVNNANVTLQSDSTASRIFTVNDQASATDLQIPAGSSLTIRGRNFGNNDTDLQFRLVSNTTTASISGTLLVGTDDAGSMTPTGSTNLTIGIWSFNGGSVYDHNRDGGSLTYGTLCTFAAGSTFRITGIVNTAPTGLFNLGTITLGTLFIDCPNNKTTFAVQNSSPTAVNILNNLEIRNTGSRTANYFGLNSTNSTVTWNVSGNVNVGTSSIRSILSLRFGTTGGVTNLNVGGNINVDANGTIIQHVGTTTLNMGMAGGLANAAIQGTGTVNLSNGSNICHVNINNAPVGYNLTLARSITVSGNLVVNTTGAVLFNTAAAQTLRVNGVLSGTGTIDMSGGARAHILQLYGATNAIGTLVPGSGSVRYENANQEVIGNKTYFNLEISGNNTATKTTAPANSNITVTGRIRLLNGTLTCGTGKVVMGNGSTVERAERGAFTGPEFTVDNPGVSRYSLSYTTLSTVRSITVGPEWTSALSTINGVSVGVGTNNYLNLNTAKTYYGTLTLSSGFIALNAFNLTSADGANFSGGSATAHIVTNGIGSFLKEGNANADFVTTYPIGSGASYAPIQITTMNRVGTGFISLRTTAHRHLTLQKTDALARYWTLGSGGGLAVTNWAGRMNNVAGEATVSTNAVGYVATHTGTSWVVNPNSATYSANQLNIPTNTTQFMGTWSAGKSGAAGSFDLTGFEIATVDGPWSTPGTWQDGSVPAASSKVIIASNVTLDPATISMDQISIVAGGSLTASTNNITTANDFLIEGSFTDNNATGTITIGGDLIFAGTVSTGTQELNILKNLYLDQDGLSIAGTVNFRGTTSNIFGTGSATLTNINLLNGSIVNVMTSGVGSGLTMNGTIGNITGNTTGQFRMGTNGILSINSTTVNGMTGGDLNDLTNFDFSAAGSTVRYFRSGDQNMVSTVYDRLEVTNGGNKNFTNAPNAAATQVLTSLITLNTITVRATATGCDSLILGSRTLANTANINNAAGTVSLVNTKRMHLVVRSSGNFMTGNGSFTTGHIWIRTTGAVPLASTLSISYTLQGDFRHISNNNFTQSTNNTTTANPGGGFLISGTSTGVTTFGNLRIRSSNTVYTLERDITVTGNSGGSNNNAGDCAFGVENTPSTGFIFNGRTVNFAGRDASSVVISNNANSFNQSAVGSLFRIVQPTNNWTCDIRGTLTSMPLAKVQVLTGNTRFILPTTLDGPFLAADTVEFNGAHTITHAPSPANTFNYQGSGGLITWSGTVVVNSGARLNSDLNVTFNGTTLTNNSTGLAGISIDLQGRNFMMDRTGNEGVGNQTIVSAASNGDMVFNNFTIDGIGTRTLPASEIIVLNRALFGPGPAPVVPTGTTGVLRVGSELVANTAYLETSGGQLNFSSGANFLTVVLHGSDNPVRNYEYDPANIVFGKLEVNTTGATPPTLALSSNFSVAREFAQTSANDFLPAANQVIRMGILGQSATITGVSAGQTTFGVLQAGDAVANSNISLGRPVTVRDSILLNFSASGGYLAINTKKLTLAGVYRAIANPILRGDANGAPSTSALELIGSANVIGAITFDPANNNLDELVYNKTGQNYALGAPIGIVGSVNSSLRLMAGTLNNGTHNISFDAANSKVLMEGGTTSNSPDYAAVNSIDFEIKTPINLSTTPLPSVASGALRKLSIAAGVGNVVSLGGVSRAVKGDLVLTSGTLRVDNAALTLGGVIDRTGGGKLETSATSTLVLNGTTSQSLPTDLFVDATPTVGTLRISNTHPDGVTMSNQGMVVSTSLNFTSSPAATTIQTPLDETKLLTLAPTATLSGEAPGRYVVGALAAQDVIQANQSNNFSGVGVTIEGVDAAEAAVMNSIGGSLQVIRRSGRAGHISNGNTGFEDNNSIMRRWSFSAVGALPGFVNIKFSWVSNDDNSCGASCNLNKMVVYRKAAAETQWTRVRSAGPNARWQNADLGNGMRQTGCFSDHFTDYTVGYGDSPLPVTWASVGANRKPGYSQAAGRQQDGKVNVVWATATEKNNSHFVVERSEDNLTFVTIGSVQAAGNTTQLSRYEFLDGSAPTSAIYYRIKQVDLDGTASYSPLAVVTAVGSTKAPLTIYPNPSTTADLVNVNGLELDEAINAQLFDANGRQIGSFSGVLANGAGLPAELRPTTAGIYQLVITPAVPTAETTAPQSIRWVVR